MSDPVKHQTLQPLIPGLSLSLPTIPLCGPLTCNVTSERAYLCIIKVKGLNSLWR